MAERKKKSYSSAVAELEEIVALLQNNDCPIDELKQHTTKSLELLRFCKEKLRDTDSELQKILEELGD